MYNMNGFETNKLLEGHSIEVHYSRQPFHRLITGGRVKEHPRCWGCVVSRTVERAVERGCSNILAGGKLSQGLLHFVTQTYCDLNLWPFGLIIITCGRGIARDYLCAKFGDASFSSFGFIVWTNTQTDRKNHRGGWSLYSRNYRRCE